MKDLLTSICAHEDAIARQWSQEIRQLPDSIYSAIDDETLQASIRRSCQALLQLMQTGDTSRMEGMLQASARQRIADGASYSDNMAVWLLYRPVVQRVLDDALQSPDAWDQLVDRVDAALDWVMCVLHTVYFEEQRLNL
jgi:hypothetical protein